MDKLRPLLPYLLLFVVSVGCIVILFPVAHESGAIRTPMDNAQVVAASRTLLERMHIDVSTANPQAQFFENRSLLKRMQRQQGLRATNQVLRDSLVGCLWKISWTRERELNFDFGRKSDERRDDQIASVLRGDISVTFDLRERLRAFRREIDDSVHIPSLTADSARGAALVFLRTYTEFQTLADTSTPSATKTTELPARTDHQFTWRVPPSSLEQDRSVRVAFAGSLLSSYEIVTPAIDDDVWDTTHRIIATAMVFVFIGLGIVMIVMTIRRLRSYEIGFRMAMIIGAITAFAFNVEIFLSYQHGMTWEMLIPLLGTPIFVGGSMVLLWAVAEATAREVWKEKLITLDLITHGHFFHSRIGQSTIRGIGLGAAALALQLILTYAADSVTPLTSKFGETDGLKLFTVASPGLFALGHSLFMTLFPYAFFAVFLISMLRKYLRSGVLVVAVAAIAMALAMSNSIAPTPIAVLVYAVSSTLVLWSFYRHEALTVLWGFITWSTAEQAGMLFVSGSPRYVQGAELIAAFFLLLLIASIVSLYRNKEVADFETIVPAFSRHISERQRMQQELEIARNVQMSFLPKQNPNRPTLDIASRCAPALEVGGDYYDFIELQDGKLGVAIGDVSGKGTQAAFFMTLTKGFLRALANIFESPASILTQVNRLFYESVERGMFISMAYGIFDTTRRTLTLARAGHNPVIMCKGMEKDVQSVNPTGMALGLDPGEAFAKSIQEVIIPFQSGDLFVFYTDGFPEAMNKRNEEFGEERFTQAVERYAAGSSAEIMEGVFKEVNSFAANANQHDDMTIVVVKVRD
jgi:sigma-B regulation protein RsbU (phosphoserine phosphatase)